MQECRAAIKISRPDASDSTLVRLLVKNTNKGDVLSVSYDFRNAGNRRDGFIEIILEISFHLPCDECDNPPLLVFFTNKPAY